MNIQLKFDWEQKKEEMIKKTHNKCEEIEKYVLNEKNTKITKKYIEEIFRNYGINYEVHDITVFSTAMTHPSYIKKDYREIKNLKSILMGINFLKGEDLFPISNEQIHMAVPLGETSYERLELVGDSILRQIISDYLFIRYKDMDEGDITKLRSQIENGSSLAEMARRIGLPKYMLIPRNLEATGAREKNNKFQCDIFEAFIAAIYYDSMKIKNSEIGLKLDLIKKCRGSSFDLCFQFVTNLIEDEIDLSLLLETETNHKDELLQQYHKLGWGDPKYNVMEVMIDNNKMGKKYFKMYVRDNEGNIIGTGVGSSKQKGEKNAAKKALQYLKIIPDDNEDIILDSNSVEIYFKNNKLKNDINKSDNLTGSNSNLNSDINDCNDYNYNSDNNMNKNNNNTFSDKKISFSDKLKLSIVSSDENKCKNANKDTNKDINKGINKDINKLLMKSPTNLNAWSRKPKVIMFD